MKPYLTGWLAPLLTLLLLFAACSTSPAQPDQSAPRQSAGESVSSPLPEVPGSKEDGPDRSSSTPPAEETPESAPAQEPPEEPESSEDPSPKEEEGTVTEDGWYNTKDEVAEYLHLYNRLPGNYKTKTEAQAAGWSGGNVDRYTGEGTAIGGDRFGNREGLLPKAQGRQYTECDIDTVGKDARGAKRIIFSNDGLIYFTDDHYNTFQLLYGEE